MASIGLDSTKGCFYFTKKEYPSFRRFIEKAQMCINLLICLPMDWEIMKNIR
ncbi:hypothetical protein [Bacteroides thetaiotaomicron]|uniref:hypothetical protein n=1 Tax=Bacteroides thetaiotaomicron TaxID=818 RepID=UPI001F5B2F5A|nr:hypothetical protein [Bacteroides thetaiotaomicron]